jgi:hypothetical protein
MELFQCHGRFVHPKATNFEPTVGSYRHYSCSEELFRGSDRKRSSLNIPDSFHLCLHALNMLYQTQTSPDFPRLGSKLLHFLQVTLFIDHLNASASVSISDSDFAALILSVVATTHTRCNTTGISTLAHLLPHVTQRRFCSGRLRPGSTSAPVLLTLLTLLTAPWRSQDPFHYKLFNF